MIRLLDNFESYVERANQATTINELFDVYSETVKKHGYDRVLFALMTSHEDLGQEAGIGVIHNFPSDWMEHYFKEGFDKIDPVILYGAQEVGAYTWQEIKTNVDLSKKQMLCMNYGEEAGLNNGVSTYLRGERNQLAGISLATSEKLDATDHAKDLITAYSNHFYIKYRALSKKKNNKEIDNIVLSEREREILTWVCLGKSNSVISDIINISESTVDFHLRNIFEKLQVNSRILAVVKALTYGIIHL